MPVPRANVSGRIVAPDEATVPVLDRGFLFGDSVYEVLWWHAGAPIQWPEHVARLRRSAALLHFAIELDDATLLDRIQDTVEATGAGPDDDLHVRLVVTRGTGAYGLLPSGPYRQSVVVLAHEARRGSAADRARGLSAAIVDRRRMARDALDPAAKTGNYLNSVLAAIEARERGAEEALFLGPEGDLVEAATANVFLVRGGAVETPPLGIGILAGTSRARLLELARRLEVPVRERRLAPADARAADELFVASSVRGVAAIAVLDGVPVGAGREGPVTRRLRLALDAAADEEAAAWRAARAAADASS